MLAQSPRRRDARRRQARPRTCSMQARRRAGLRSFPGRPPSGSACPASGPTPPGAAGRSRSPDPSAASPGRSSARRTPCASGKYVTSVTPIVRTASATACPVPSEHQPAAASRRSLPACGASLPSLHPPKWSEDQHTGMDHFKGRDSDADGRRPSPRPSRRQ